MRVFITGAAGFIGQATTKELIAHGHHVIGLVRTDEQTEKIKALGAEPLKGDLFNLESLQKGAKQADGVIHLAFVFDFEDFPRACAADRAAIETMGLYCKGKPLVIASGTLMSTKGHLATEDTPADRNFPPFDQRALSADLIYSMSKEQGIRGCVVRIPPTVHGAGEKGFVPMLTNVGRPGGSVWYAGEGTARWPAVYIDDIAVLMRLVLERGKPGSTYNAVGDQAVPMKDIMAAASTRVGLPLKSLSMEEAKEKMGFMAITSTLDNPTSSVKTQQELGWKPVGPSLIQDIETNYVF